MNTDFWSLIVNNIPAIIVSITGFVAIFVGNKGTKREITNSHPQHLREDLDEKHNDTISAIQEFERIVISRHDRMEERESTMLERVGNIEDNANKEHRNI